MSESVPRVSVLIPSYNHARFVVGAVQSALDQTETDLEILVIDDGSTDDSLARLAALDDARLTVLSQENRGLSRTLNRGLERARGRWVKFLPSDDMLAPRCLERELAVAQAERADLVFCLPEVVDAGGRPLADPAPQAWFDSRARDERDLLPGLVERNFLSAPGALFDGASARRLGGFDPEMRVAQDYDLWLRLLAHARARLVPERLVRVRWHGDNQSAVATPATEAERARALTRALAEHGREVWIARFAGTASGRRAAIIGRRGLAGALTRSGLAEVQPLARELAGEADRLERDGRRVSHLLGGVVRRALRALHRASRRRASDAPAADRPGARVGTVEGASQAARREHWLVLDPEPVPAPDGSARARRFAEALARRGLAVTYATPLAAPGALTGRASGLAGGASAVTELRWSIGDLRALLVGRDERLRVLVGAPHPEAAAFAREARDAGARVLYDRALAWESRRDLAWLDGQGEERLIEGSDDLLAPERALAGRLGRRIVHLLPSPGAGDARAALAVWDAHAASLVELTARPTATAILLPGPPGADVPGLLTDLLGGSEGFPYRVAVVLDRAADADEERAVEEIARASQVLVLRSPLVGLAAARALALRATGGELVALVAAELSRDAFPTGWLEEPARALLSCRALGAVGLAMPIEPRAARRALPEGVAAPESGERESAALWEEVAELDGAVIVATRMALGRAARAGKEMPEDGEGNHALGCALRNAGYRLGRLG